MDFLIVLICFSPPNSGQSHYSGHDGYSTNKSIIKTFHCVYLHPYTQPPVKRRARFYKLVASVYGTLPCKFQGVGDLIIKGGVVTYTHENMIDRVRVSNGHYNTITKLYNCSS